MFGHLLKICLLAILTLSVGLNYSIINWFDYSFLGINKGVLQSFSTFFGYASIVLGMLIIITLFLRKFMNVKMNDQQLVVLMSIVFVLQLPVASLWFMALLLNGMHAIVGTAIHCFILLLLGLTFLTEHRLHKNVLRLKNHGDEIQVDT